MDNVTVNVPCASNEHCLRPMAGPDQKTCLAREHTGSPDCSGYIQQWWEPWIWRFFRSRHLVMRPWPDQLQRPFLPHYPSQSLSAWSPTSWLNPEPHFYFCCLFPKDQQHGDGSWEADSCAAFWLLLSLLCQDWSELITKTDLECTEHSLGIKHGSKHFTCITPWNPHSTPRRKMLLWLSIFCRCDHWGSERLSN